MCNRLNAIVDFISIYFSCTGIIFVYVACVLSVLDKLSPPNACMFIFMLGSGKKQACFVDTLPYTYELQW